MLGLSGGGRYSPFKSPHGVETTPCRCPGLRAQPQVKPERLHCCHPRIRSYPFFCSSAGAVLGQSGGPGRFTWQCSTSRCFAQQFRMLLCMLCWASEGFATHLKGKKQLYQTSIPESSQECVMTCLPVCTFAVFPPDLGPGQVIGISTHAVLEYAVSSRLSRGWR